MPHPLRTLSLLGILGLVMLNVTGCATVSGALHFSAGTRALEEGNFELAVAELEEARKANPDWSKIRNNLGTAYSKIGRHTDAWQEFCAAVLAPPANAQAANNFKGYWNTFIADGVLDKGTSKEAVRRHLSAPNYIAVCNKNVNQITWLYGLNGVQFENGKIVSTRVNGTLMWKKIVCW